MTTGSDISAAVQGYLQLGHWWLQAWGSHATGVATRLESGAYGVDEASADLAACARLAIESGFLLVNETVDALAVLSGGHHQPHLVRSVTFTVPPGSVESGASAWLELTGPLVAALGGATIPTAVVSFDPNPTGPNDSGFVLVVDATGREGVTYVGEVAVHGPDGGVTDLVPVWVAVP